MDNNIIFDYQSANDGVVINDTNVSTFHNTTDAKVKAITLNRSSVYKVISVSRTNAGFFNAIIGRR